MTCLYYSEFRKWIFTLRALSHIAYGKLTLTNIRLSFATSILCHWQGKKIKHLLPILHSPGIQFGELLELRSARSQPQNIVQTSAWLTPQIVNKPAHWFPPHHLCRRSFQCIHVRVTVPQGANSSKLYKTLQYVHIVTNTKLIREVVLKKKKNHMNICRGQCR